MNIRLDSISFKGDCFLTDHKIEDLETELSKIEDVCEVACHSWIDYEEQDNEYLSIGKTEIILKVKTDNYKYIISKLEKRLKDILSSITTEQDL